MTGDFNFNDFLPDNQEVEKLDTLFKKEEKESDIVRNDDVDDWYWNGKKITEIPNEFKDHQSFVYLITNKVTKRKYIGFKTIVSRKRTTIKGKKKTILIDSDWRTYYSSSQELLHDVGKYGKGNFLREIIAFTVNKGVGKYYEALQQFKREVITKNHNHYYNGIVNLRLNHKLVAQFDQIVEATVILGDKM